MLTANRVERYRHDIMDVPSIDTSPLLADKQEIKQFNRIGAVYGEIQSEGIVLRQCRVISKAVSPLCRYHAHRHLICTSEVGCGGILSFES